MKKKRPLVRKWVRTLSKRQMAKALETTILRLIETEELNILEGDDRGPYWDSCGEGLLEEEQTPCICRRKSDSHPHCDGNCEFWDTPAAPAQEKECCPVCGGEVSCNGDGTWKCIAAIDCYIGCGWSGEEPNYKSEVSS